MSIESPKSETSITYENQEPIANIEEALQLINQNNGPENRNMEVCVVDSNKEIRIVMGEISGWPEQVGATKNYRLDETIFEELKKRGHIQRMNPTTWVSSSY